jgi:endonuclease/exonuclease/phosphatase family metal-dependent hydrolase
MRLLTWNVQWCRGIDGVVDPGRIASEVRRLADPDVACFQEVTSGELAAHFPEYQAFYVAGVDVAAEGGGRSRFGNLLLSRLPVGRVRRHSLPWPPSPEAPSMPRVALEAVIEAPFGALRVTTTHLEYYSAEHRAAQIGRLRALHAEACSERRTLDEPGPFRSAPLPQSAIVCGDFNLPPEDPLHERLLQFGFADAWQAVNPGAPHPPTFRLHERAAGESPFCCDYVFVTADLVPRLRAVAVDRETQASDHQPLIVVLG